MIRGFFIFFIFSVCFALGLYAQDKYKNHTSLDSVIACYLEKVNPDSIAFYMQELENMGTRFCLAGNRKDVAVWIRNKFIEFGYTDTQLDSFLMNNTYQGVAYETWQYNVVSTMTGYARPNEIYIMGAHHDAIISQPGNPFITAPGADDNGSGVAAALEVARVLKQYNYQPEATIRFISFAAEEVGLKGSWHYASNACLQNMNIRMMINNDMISYTIKPPGEWMIKLFKYSNAVWLANLANYIAQNHTILSTAEFTHTSANTDSWPFYHYGYSAIFLHENDFCPFYHSENDLVLNTNKYYAAEMIRVSLGMLIHENGTGLNVHVPAMDQPVNSRLFKNYPNPFSDQTTIKYFLSNPGDVLLQIFDDSNRLVTVLQNGWQEAGSHHVIFYAVDLPAGLYFCRLQTGSGTAVIKIATY